RDEVTQLARKYGIVTPYTSYLITEEETKRNVPTAARTVGQTRFARETADGGEKAEYESFRRDKDGARGVAAAQATSEMKLAGGGKGGASSGSVMRDNGAGFGGVTASTPSTSPGEGPGVAAQPRVVRNRAFYLNGD